MEPHSLVGGTGEGGWSCRGLACGLQDQRLAGPPTGRAGGKSGLLTGGKSGKPNGYSLPSPKVPTHVPSPPSRWARAVTTFNVRLQARYPTSEVQPPPHHPTREGGPGGGTSSPGGSFPHFFPRNGAPAGQAKVPCRSNGGRKERLPHRRDTPTPPLDSKAPG